MATINTLLKKKKSLLSFEIFPPKTEKGLAGIRETLESFRAFQPDFVSVTYGAMGTTRETSLQISGMVKNEFGFEAMSHLTCVGHTREELQVILEKIRQAGIENIMALRGDPPQGETTWKPVPGGLAHANELVELIRREFPKMGIGVAGYPEKHIEAADFRTDLENLKKKVDAGGDFIVTQLFFDNAALFRFREACVQAGIKVPILAGIMPISDAAQVKRFTGMCGASIPSSLLKKLEAVAENPEAVVALGIDYAVEQCRELLAQGVAGLHFYTLNKSRQVGDIVSSLAAR